MVLPVGPGFSPGSHRRHRGLEVAPQPGSGQAAAVAGVSYEGAASVFVTCVTHDRHRAFEDREVCEFALSELFDKCEGSVEVTLTV